MIVPYGIVNKTTVGFFDSSKNMAAVTKNRTGGLKAVFHKYLKIGKVVQTFVGQMIC